jgi:hypothetical protein
MEERNSQSTAETAAPSVRTSYGNTFLRTVSVLVDESSHYPREIAREIEIDKNFNLDRAIYTLRTAGRS